jgi:adenylate cyclase
VAFSVAGVIEPTLQAAETARSANRPTTDLTAYDLYLRGYATAMTSAARFPEGFRLIEQAIERDPGYAPALAWAAVCSMRSCQDGGSDDPKVDIRKGTDFARRALDVTGDDPAVLANAAYALAYFGEDIDSMIALVDRALALNPSFARGWYISSALRLWAGRPDIAIEHADAALRLNPRDRLGWVFLTIGAAHFVRRRFDEALPKLLLAAQHDPSNQGAYRHLIASYAHMGRLDDARAVIQRLRAVTPQIVPTTMPYRNPVHRELLFSGLRLAVGEKR